MAPAPDPLPDWIPAEDRAQLDLSELADLDEELACACRALGDRLGARVAAYRSGTRPQPTGLCSRFRYAALGEAQAALLHAAERERDGVIFVAYARPLARWQHHQGETSMYDQEFWNTRYASDGYVYGTEPNAFLAEHHGLLTGPVLSLCEGEGRNAVFLASRGSTVLGVDISPVALGKAQKLAEARGVKIETALADLATYEPEAQHYGAVVSIFAHLPSAVRHRLYPRIERSLKPGGILLLEAYSEHQLSRDTGGPKDADMLMTVDKLQRELPNLEPMLLREVERHVAEGGGHTGMGSVVQLIAKRKA